MNFRRVFCLFEQSGTFKDSFRELGFDSYDIDISNEFDKVDYLVDIFEEIDNYFNSNSSIFDLIDSKDLVMAFYPCIRFENQILLAFRGDNYGLRNMSKADLIRYNMKLQDELHDYINYLNKLVLISLEKGFKLIIENPYSEQSYLIRYWCEKPAYIDYDRRKKGDYFKKPTMYYFINCEPEINLFFKGHDIKIKKLVDKEKRGISRSLISHDYAKSFIKECILDCEG